VKQAERAAKTIKRASSDAGGNYIERLFDIKGGDSKAAFDAVREGYVFVLSRNFGAFNGEAYSQKAESRAFFLGDNYNTSLSFAWLYNQEFKWFIGASSDGLQELTSLFLDKAPCWAKGAFIVAPNTGAGRKSRFSGGAFLIYRFDNNSDVSFRLMARVLANKNYAGKKNVEKNAAKHNKNFLPEGFVFKVLGGVLWHAAGVYHACLWIAHALYGAVAAKRDKGKAELGAAYGALNKAGSKANGKNWYTNVKKAGKNEVAKFMNGYEKADASTSKQKRDQAISYERICVVKHAKSFRVKMKKERRERIILAGAMQILR